MPEEGIELKPHHAILRLEQIALIVEQAAALGIYKVKITGGEPLVRKNVQELVRLIAALPGITDLSMTTNGSLLTREKAHVLKRAGLNRINISLDTLDPERFFAITRGGAVNQVLAGIDAAAEARLHPIKINMVVFADTADSDIAAMQQFCASRGLSLQTIAHFSLSQRNSVAVKAADKPPPCETCNRLRLTADGFLKPCLFSDHEIKVDFSDIRGSLIAAINAKPATGSSCSSRVMSQIGG